MNMQFPQTISKRQEPKCFLICSLSTLVHKVLYFQPCMQFYCQPVHIICNIEYREEQQGDFMRERLAAELAATTLQSLGKNSELTHLHEQIWTVLNTLSPSFDPNTHLKGHLTCHELGIVSTYHMWRSQKNIICPDNIVSIRKFQWSFKGKETTLRYHFIKSLYLLKEQC